MDQIVETPMSLRKSNAEKLGDDINDLEGGDGNREEKNFRVLSLGKIFGEAIAGKKSINFLICLWHPPDH